MHLQGWSIYILHKWPMLLYNDILLSVASEPPLISAISSASLQKCYCSSRIRIFFVKFTVMNPPGLRKFKTTWLPTHTLHVGVRMPTLANTHKHTCSSSSSRASRSPKFYLFFLFHMHLIQLWLAHFFSFYFCRSHSQSNGKYIFFLVK